MEGELISRIRGLERQLVHGLPPQLNEGEYENIVRQNLNGAMSIRHFQSALDLEQFDITIMELKENLQNNKLFNLLLSEPDARLTEILSQSPFHEKNIRSEAYDFIEERVRDLNTRSQAQRVFLENYLRNFIRDSEQNGHLSAIYREFLQHFLGQG